MTGETFEDLLKWVLQKDSRTMDIKVGKLQPYSERIQVFVYDHELATGQHVNNAAEIDLRKANKEMLEDAVKRLEVARKAIGD